MNEETIRFVYYNRHDLSKSGIYEFKISKNKDIKGIWKSYLENGYIDKKHTKPMSFIGYLALVERSSFRLCKDEN